MSEGKYNKGQRAMRTATEGGYLTGDATPNLQSATPNGSREREKRAVR